MNETEEVTALTEFSSLSCEERSFLAGQALWLVAHVSVTAIRVDSFFDTHILLLDDQSLHPR